MGWTTIVKGGHHEEEWYYLLPVLHFLVVMETTRVETVKWILDCKSLWRDVMIVSHYWDIELPIYLPTPMLLFKSGHEIPRASAHARLCTGVKLAQTPCLLHHHPAICPLAVEAGDSNTGTGPHCTALLGISGLTELIADPSFVDHWSYFILFVWIHLDNLYFRSVWVNKIGCYHYLWYWCIRMGVWIW